MDNDFDYKQAAKELLKDAKHGDSEAQCLLGQMYFEGLGVKQDYKKATLWLQKAAQQGNEEAKTILEKIPKPEPKVTVSDPTLKKPRIKHHLPVKKIALASALVLFTVLTALGAIKLWDMIPMTVNDVVKKVLPATVFISVERENGGGTGSGFFAQDGKIFTNAHVIENAKKITIKTYNGKPYEAEVLDENKELDLAVLTAKIHSNEYSNLNFSPEIPTPGNEIVVIGSPLGFEQTVSNGIISAVRQYDNDLTLLQISAPISPGSSGSPVVNMKGQVVGVATLTNTKGQNLNFAVSQTSINRKFKNKDPYLVQPDVPIVKDNDKIGLLRVNSSKNSGTEKSPEGDSVRILDTKKLEVRLLAKVRSEKNGEIYWIDSNFVKQPVKMKFDEFLEKFNDGLASSERLSPSDFSKINAERRMTGSKNSSIYSIISLTFDSDDNISKVQVFIQRGTGNNAAAELNSWIQQAVKVFYPNSLIAGSFFVELLGKSLESLVSIGGLFYHHADIEKFPIKFNMAAVDAVATLTIDVNNLEDKKPEKSAASTPPTTPTITTKPVEIIQPVKPSKPKLTNLRDPQYLNDIRAAIKGMPVIEEDEFREMFTYQANQDKYIKHLNFEPYITHFRGSGNVFIRLLIGFNQSDWVFTKKIIFNCDGKNFTFTAPEASQRDVIWGNGIYERYDLPITDEISFIKNAISSKKVRVRFDGDNKVADRTLSKQDIQNLRKCYECYKKLVAVEGKYER